MAGRILSTSALIAALAMAPIHAHAQERVSYNLFGLPGLIDMPVANESPDATLNFTYGHLGDFSRTTMMFQIMPRLSGAFRYTSIRNFNHPASKGGKYFDRNFDLRYQLFTENALRPAVTIGLQDFIGTGLYGAEYIVASKTVAPGLTLTGGLGWGRLGSFGAIGSTGKRPNETLGQGGIPTYDRWFRGDVAPFGGISYSPTGNWSIKAEYSSDDYSYEQTFGRFQRKSPWSYGLDYSFRNGAQFSVYQAYGTEIGAKVSFGTQLNRNPVTSGLESAPVPVAVRQPSDIRDLGWTNDTNAKANSFAALSAALKTDGLILEGLDLTAREARVRLRNPKYDSEPEAIGRTARAMTRNLPASVETFVIVPVVNGIPMSAVKINRSDLEALEHDSAAKILAKTAIVDGYKAGPAVEKGLYPKFNWAFAPYVSLSFFDPDNPVRADYGLRASASYEITPNLELAGVVTRKLGGNLDSVIRASNSKLPHVRTDYAKYSMATDTAIQSLTLSHFGRPAKDLYSRVTVGYLETMYGGVSTELLWKPVSSRLALGAELNYVRQRDYDQKFGFQNYDILTGHMSAYYDFGNEFMGQVDVGRYLAGDYGATVSLDREFANGWSVGAYATFTDTPFNDFGEGSFDKGIRISVPLATTTNQPSRRRNNIVIKSLTRDGGAKVEVNDRLYDRVRNYHRPQLEKEWGKFWR